MCESFNAATQIWADETTNEALNSVKVYIHRLRRKLGVDAIVSSGRGYALGPHVMVDLNELEAVLEAAQLQKNLDERQRRRLKNALQINPDDVHSRKVRWAWFAGSQPRIETAIRNSGIALALDSLVRGAGVEAITALRRLFERDSCDEPVCELLVVALLKHGESVEARRTLQRHEKALSAEFGAEASERVRALLLPASAFGES